jgi:hypothetical protein
MTADNRAALAAHEALNRVADDVIAGRIDPHAQQAAAPQPAQPYTAEQYAQEQYAQYAEPQAYQQDEYPADPAAQQTYAEHYAAQQAQQPDLYAQPVYTPEQQAAAEAYAAQFAASIGETAVASVTQHYPPEPEAAPAVAVSPVAALAAAAPVATVVKEKRQGIGAFTLLTAAVALLSLCMSFYQGYLFHRSIDLMEKNVARGEFIRTCRDIIGTYFDVKQRVGTLMPAADRGNVAGAARVTEANRVEAQAAIARFGGLGTYLANFQNIETRERYTELTRTLNGILDVARTTPLTDIDRLFAPADKLFAGMNQDCVNLSRTMRM